MATKSRHICIELILITTLWASCRGAMEAPIRSREFNQHDPTLRVIYDHIHAWFRDRRGLEVATGRSKGHLGGAVQETLPRPWHPRNVLFRAFVALFQACPYIYLHKSSSGDILSWVPFRKNASSWSLSRPVEEKGPPVTISEEKAGLTAETELATSCNFSEGKLNLWS